MRSKPARVAIVAALTVLLHIPAASSEQTAGQGNRPAAIEAVYVGSIGGGPSKGHFRHPRGIAVDDAGRVFVADSYCRVQVFDADGGFLYMWGGAGEGPGQFRCAAAIALDQAGLVYVADALNARIQVFTREGVFLRQWGSKGSGAGQFLRPVGIAVNAEGHVYVADTYNYRIQVFANDGTFLRSWGSKGTAPGQFHDPEALDGTGPGPDGIAVDRNGVVYVSDPWNRRVQVFTSDGRYLREWGRLARPCGQFDTPAAIGVCNRGYLSAPGGIAVDRNGSVLVVNQD